MRLRSHHGDRVHGEQHTADLRIRVAAHQADSIPRFGPAGLVAGVERSDDPTQAGHSVTVARCHAPGPTRWQVRGWPGGCTAARSLLGRCRHRPLLPLRVLRCSWSTWGRGSRWTQQGSNLRPTPCKGAALPAELWVRAGRPRPNQPNDRDHSPVALRSDVSAQARAPAPPPPRRPTRARRATAKPARRDPAVRPPTPPVRRTHRRGTRSRPVGVPASLTHRRCTGRGLPSSPGCVGSRGRPTPAGRPAPRSSTVTAPGPGQSGGRSNGRRASIPLIWRLSRPSLMRWRRSPRLDAGYSEASTLTYSAWSRASDSAFTTLYRTMPALSMMNVARNAAPLLSSKTP